MVRMPSPEQQARFFTNLQLLLTEGEFVSTYKFALLIALTRWAMENPDHDETIPLDVAALAPHFLELYWPHTRPFGVAALPATDWDGVLVQDRGGQTPKVLKLIKEAQQTGHDSIKDLPIISRERLLGAVKNSIQAIPLWKLQMVDGEAFPFLYHRGSSDQWICFLPGIVACLANFALLVEHVVRAAWLRFVLRCNPLLLGAACQVEEFLFPSGRGSLAAWRPVLEEVQGNRCFYCANAISSTAAIDHFLPWSRYPRDLGHNFVLVHADCNQQKRDHLASCEHLANWCRRNDEHRELLAQRFDASGLPHDWPTLRRVAGSLYHIAANTKAVVWHAGNQLVPLTSEWRHILGCA